MTLWLNATIIISIILIWDDIKLVFVAVCHCTSCGDFVVFKLHLKQSSLTVIYDPLVTLILDGSSSSKAES